MKLRFTLLELLIVIAIIVMLAGFLLPALKKAQEMSRRIFCSNNVKTLTTCSILYSNDYNGIFPFAAVDTSTVRPTWAMLISPYLQINTDTAFWNPEKFKMFECPSNKNAPAAWLSINKHFAPSSYCANLEVMDRLTIDCNSDGRKGGAVLSAVRYPAATITFAELHSVNNSVGWSTDNAKCYNSGFTYEYTVQNGTPYDDMGKRGYHLYSNNWSFCDGHVEAMKWEKTINPMNLWKMIK